MDAFKPEEWKQQWIAFMNAPYIMLPLLAVVALAAWWFRGKTTEGTIAGLKGQVAVFNSLQRRRWLWLTKPREKSKVSSRYLR